MPTCGSTTYVEFLARTGTLSPVNILTPSVGGLYLVTLYIEDVTPTFGGGDGTANCSLGWTDDASTKTKLFQSGSAATFNPLSVYQASGSSITLTANDGGNSRTYNIFVSMQLLTIGC